MADVRALLRQQRAARRIDHPLAAYSDSGKLSCTACREPIKSESLWEGHLRSAGHRQRLQQGSSSRVKDGNAKPAPTPTPASSSTPRYAGFVDDDDDRHHHIENQSSDIRNGYPASIASTSTTASKRRHGGGDSDEETQDEDAARRKRNKTDLATHEGEGVVEPSVRSGKPLTPPLTRRTSGTPTFGVEMQIPSRPATPSRGEDRSNGTPMSISGNTPKPAPTVNRSPLIPNAAATSQPTTTTAGTTVAPVDDDVWAAFEADLVQEKPKPAVPAALAALEGDAVISAPVMSAAEIQAKSEEEEKQKRRALADIQIEDEKEDATRALETEFEVMEELEARARKLRERREALRLRAGSVEASGGGGVPDAVKGQQQQQQALGKENTPGALGMDEEDDEDDEEDDWDGFRFRV